MTVSFRPPVVCLLAGAALLGSCKSAPLQPIESRLGPGWQCFVAPSSFEAPGTIFRLDQAKRKWQTAKIGKPEDVEVGDFAVGKVTVNNSLALGAVVAVKITEALREKGVDKPVDVSAQATAGATRRVVVEFGQAKREVTYDPIKASAEKHFESYPPESGSTYFLVREGLVANRIAIQLDSTLTQELGGTVKLDGIASVTSSLRRNKDGTYALDATYAQPLRACIKPERLVVEKVGLNGKTAYKFVPQVEPLVIVE